MKSKKLDGAAFYCIVFVTCSLAYSVYYRIIFERLYSQINANDNILFFVKNLKSFNPLIPLASLMAPTQLYKNFMNILMLKSQDLGVPLFLSSTMIMIVSNFAIPTMIVWSYRTSLNRLERVFLFLFLVSVEYHALNLARFGPLGWTPYAAYFALPFLVYYLKLVIIANPWQYLMIAVSSFLHPILSAMSLFIGTLYNISQTKAHLWVKEIFFASLTFAPAAVFFLFYKPFPIELLSTEEHLLSYRFYVHSWPSIFDSEWSKTIMTIVTLTVVVGVVAYLSKEKRSLFENKKFIFLGLAACIFMSLIQILGEHLGSIALVKGVGGRSFTLMSVFLLTIYLLYVLTMFKQENDWINKTYLALVLVGLVFANPFVVRFESALLILLIKVRPYFRNIKTLYIIHFINALLITNLFLNIKLFQINFLYLAVTSFGLFVGWKYIAESRIRLIQKDMYSACLILLCTSLSIQIVKKYVDKYNSLFSQNSSDWLDSQKWAKMNLNTKTDLCIVERDSWMIYSDIPSYEPVAVFYYTYFPERKVKEYDEILLKYLRLDATSYSKYPQKLYSDVYERTQKFNTEDFINLAKLTGATCIVSSKALRLKLLYKNSSYYIYSTDHS